METRPLTEAEVKNCTKEPIKLQEEITEGVSRR